MKQLPQIQPEDLGERCKLSQRGPPAANVFLWH